MPDIGIPNYEEKVDFLSRRQSGLCPLWLRAGKYIRLDRCKKVDLHHFGIHWTLVNEGKFPLLMHSVLNMYAVDHDAHMRLPANAGRFSPDRANSLEVFLSHHERICEWVNNPRGLLFTGWVNYNLVRCA